MEGDCEECNTLEQSIYWTHFQSIHFCQILGSDYRSQLMIPKKFSDNAKGRLKDKVTLKGPSGTMLWEVGLETSGNVLFLRDGWIDFVNAYSLEESDILIFRYNGNSSFSTLMFDSGSLCEKESSYFLKKCGHSRPRNKNQEKGFLKEILEEFTQEYSHEKCKPSPSKKPRMVNDGRSPVSPHQHIAADFSEMSHAQVACNDIETAEERFRNQQRSRAWKFVKPITEQCAASDVPGISCGEVPFTDDEGIEERPRHLQELLNREPVMVRPEQCIAPDVPEMGVLRTPYTDVEAAAERPRNQQKSWSWEPVKFAQVTKKKKAPKKVDSIRVATNCSKRAVTENQKEATLRMAREELTVDSFLVVMRPSSVSSVPGVYYLNVPAAWMSQHLIFKTQTVKLRRNEKTWVAKLKCRPNGRAGITVGWKEFVLDNSLEEFDVCVFKLASPNLDEPIVLDVSIFRVVPDAMK